MKIHLQSWRFSDLDTCKKSIEMLIGVYKGVDNAKVLVLKDIWKEISEERIEKFDSHEFPSKIKSEKSFSEETHSINFKHKGVSKKSTDTKELASVTSKIVPRFKIARSKADT